MNEKEINKKLRKNNPQDDNTLLYILSFVLFACLVALAVIWYYNWKASQSFDENFFEPEQERLESLKEFYKEVKDLVRLKKINQRRKDAYQKKLDTNFNPKLTSQQRAQIQEKLNKLDSYPNPVEVAARLELIRNRIFTKELQQEWLEVQQNFLKNTFPRIEEKAKEKLDETIKFFFEHFFKKVSEREPEKITWRGFEIINFNGKEYGFSKEEHETCKSLIASKYREFPPWPQFKGFERFLDKRDEEKHKKKEGKVTLGLTVSWTDEESENYYKPYWVGNVTKIGFKDLIIDKGEEKTVIRREGPIQWIPDGNFALTYTWSRSICIRLKKEFLFGLGSEERNEWIQEKGNNIFITDISWEAVRETIAHELAHAVIDKMMKDYNEWQRKTGRPGDGEGHGELHTAYTNEIEDIIKTHPKGKELEDWWKKK